MRRALVAMAAALGASGVAADTACRRDDAADPRLEELLRADPTDPRIDIDSTAGELARDGSALLKGDVRIRVGQRLLTADEAQIDAERRSVTLRGNVEYLDPTLHVQGDGGTLQEGGNGVFEGAQFELTERGVRGAASDVKVRDQSVLELSDVWYTACPRGYDDWRLQAREIEIDQKTRQGTGRDVRLEFQGVPIMYSPYVSFPVGDQRKSGFLFPTIGSSSRAGTQIAVPWYWNIAPNYDATFTGRYMSKRGLRVDPEFRYLTARSRGQLNAEYLAEDLEEDRSRSLVRFEDITHLQPRLRLLVDAANVSDDDYFEDFGVGFEGTSVIFLNRVGEVRYESPHFSIEGRAQNYQVIDRELALEDRPYTLLPQIAATARLDDFAGGFDTGMRGELSNFQRNVGVEGVRLDLEPYLDWRVDRPGWYAAASGAYSFTQYSLDHTEVGADDSPSRDAPILNLDTGLIFERHAGSRGQRVQTLEPRVSYLYVPFREQDDLPVFDTGVPDLNLVQLFRTNRYVGPDRLGDANQISMGLTTRLLDRDRGRQFLSATIGQAYYFDTPRVRLPDEPDLDRETSDLIAEVELTAYQNWNVRMAGQWNPEESQGERSEVYVRYSPRGDKVINAGYRFRRQDVEQVDLSAAWPIHERWRGFARWVYSLREEKTLDQFVGFEYGSCCWAVRMIARRFVSSRTGDSDTSVGLELELKGLSSVGVDNETFLRDAIRGYSALPAEPPTPP